MVVVLAGGTGGAKLARGMLDVVGAELVVIANTADDVEVHGGYVSPDPDLVTFWLADRIDEPLDEDVLICGDRRADKVQAAEILQRIPGLRAVDAGRLEMSRIAEALTALMISINAKYKAHAGVRIANLPDHPHEAWPHLSSS